MLYNLNGHIMCPLNVRYTHFKYAISPNYGYIIRQGFKG